MRMGDLFGRAVRVGAPLVDRSGAVVIPGFEEAETVFGFCACFGGTSTVRGDSDV